MSRAKLDMRSEKLKIGRTARLRSAALVINRSKLDNATHAVWKIALHGKVVVSFFPAECFLVLWGVDQT